MSNILPSMNTLKMWVWTEIHPKLEVAQLKKQQNELPAELENQLLEDQICN